MLELKHSEIQLKAKGSEDLVSKLQYGDIKAIADVFNIDHKKIRSILLGRYFGDKRIVECAERLVAFYASVDLEYNVKSIINSYAATNQD